jgi:hypothetical protein
VRCEIGHRSRVAPKWAAPLGAEHTTADFGACSIGQHGNNAWKRQRLHVLVVAAMALAGSYLTSAPSDTVKVEGGLISGTEANGVRVFNGIPFPAPANLRGCRQ